MKSPLTPAGIEPATFRIVAQHPNHCATAVPKYISGFLNICTESSGVLDKSCGSYLEVLGFES